MATSMLSPDYRKTIRAIAVALYELFRTAFWVVAMVAAFVMVIYGFAKNPETLLPLALALPTAIVAFIAIIFIDGMPKEFTEKWQALIRWRPQIVAALLAGTAYYGHCSVDSSFWSSAHDYRVVVVQNAPPMFLLDANKVSIAVEPFTTTVVGFSAKLQAQRTCEAVTRDKSAVIARVRAELHLPFEGVRLAYQNAGTQAGLQARADDELCSQYRIAVSQYDLANLPSRLVLDAKTLEAESDMRKLGLHYNGVFAVDSLNLVARSQSR